MHAETPLRNTSYSRAGMLGIIAIAIVILVSGAIISATRAQDLATPMVDDATPVVTANICDATAPGAGAEPWVRTELYFGTTLPDGSPLTADQWADFLDEEITPRFPAGLTVLEGYGQFLNSQGVMIEEASIVLILFYPGDAIEDSSAGIEEIRDAYEVQFEQESVLRVDSEPVCVSF